MDRYHRQQLLPQIGPGGIARLRESCVFVVGLGALGGTISEQLARAGVGKLVIADRDTVEWTNLQRQVLFSEQDARERRPKAIAAMERLAEINADVELVPLVRDVEPDNIRAIVDEHHPTIILDGTDNVGTRYLINDLSVERSIPWIYGACVGTEGRAMLIEPGRTPCLRCLYPTPPAAGELPTCDVAGVLGPAASVSASIQAGLAIQWIASPGSVVPTLVTFDLWAGRFRSIDTTDSRRSDCPCCAKKQFEFLNHPGVQSASLCGRNAVQVRSHGAIDLQLLAERLRDHFSVEINAYLVRVVVEEGIEITAFADGRCIVHGTGDIARARGAIAKYIGA